MFIQTVLGPIAPESLGVTMAHEHIICDWALSRRNSNRVRPLPWGSYMCFDDVDIMIDELLKYRVDGGSAIVEVTTHGWGRDPLALERISKESGIHIVATTGFYTEDCMPDWVSNKTVDQLAKWIKREVTVGCNAKMSDEVTNVRAGIIKTSVSRPSYSHNELKGLLAVARAQLMTGAPITSHNSGSIRFELKGGNIGGELLDILEGEGVEPEAVIVGHTDEKTDVRALASLAKRGAWIQFDTIGKEGYILDETRADLVVKLKERGLLGHLLLGQDRNRKPELRRYGGPGFSDVLNRFVNVLRDRGLQSEDVNTLLVRNPAKALRMREPSH